jgi:hypothetical protein
VDAIAANATPAATTGAIDALVALIAGATEAKRDDAAKEAADVLVQVSLANSGFATDIQKHATAALAKLAATSPRGVLLKALHLLSDEREDDTAEQMEAERHAAIGLARTVAKNSAASEQLRKSDALPALMKTVQRVLGALTVTQFIGLVSQLIAIFCNADVPAASAALMDVVAAGKLDNAKAWETILFVGARLPQGTTYDAALDKLMPLVQKKTALDGADAAMLLKAFATAASWASAEGAAKHFEAARDLLVKVDKHADASGNAAMVEAALKAVAALAKAKGAEWTHDEVLGAVAAKLVEANTNRLKDLIFVVKKQAAAGNATEAHARWIRSLQNIIALATPLAAKDLKVLPTVKPSSSWAHHVSLAGAPGPKAAAPAAKATAAAKPLSADAAATGKATVSAFNERIRGGVKRPRS